jgi:hypothetical protein
MWELNFRKMDKTTCIHIFSLLCEHFRGGLHIWLIVEYKGTTKGRLIIEGWGIPCLIQIVVEIIVDDKWNHVEDKLGFNLILIQALNDVSLINIRLFISLKECAKKVWWCKSFEMKYLPSNYTKWEDIHIFKMARNQKILSNFVHKKKKEFWHKLKPL